MTTPSMIDPVAVYAKLLHRTALRREAGLPRINVLVCLRQEVAYWRADELHVRYYRALRAEVVERLVKDYGPNKVIGRAGAWLVHIATLKLLEARCPVTTPNGRLCNR